MILRLALALLVVLLIIAWYKSARPSEAEKNLPWHKRTWLWAISAMIIIALFTASISVILENRARNGNYVPSRFENGVFIPGDYE